MPDSDDRLAHYLEHLRTKKRSRAALPAGLSALCSSEPAACLELIVAALAETLAPDEVAAVGEGLMQDLLNEHAGRIADQVGAQLRASKRFRQAFGFGNYASVDPAVIEDWVGILERLGTTKERERKSTWRG